jgi:hypothetical protein
MIVVGSMAKAYVEQTINPDYSVFVVDITDSGECEVKDGPVNILNTGKLYGDRTKLYSTVLTILRTLLIALIVWSFLLYMGDRDFCYSLVAISCWIFWDICRRAEFAVMRRSLDRATAFFEEVRDLTGIGGMTTALRHHEKGL